MSETKTLPEWVDSYMSLQRAMPEAICSAVKYLKDLGVTQLGFWSYDFIACYENTPQYNDEDEALFSDLEPAFELDLDYGESEYECEGRYVGVRIFGTGNCKEDMLQVIYFSNDSERVYINKLSDCESQKTKWNILHAIIKSVEFNVANNIPVEKWGVMHNPDVNPYTLEYVG